MSLVTGIDCIGENPLAVVVESESDHRRVTRLAQLEDLQPLSDDQELTVAVPDPAVMVKPLTLRETDPGELADRSRFELAAGLLESDRLFAFDLITTAQPERFLGLVYRTSLLDDCRASLFPTLRPDLTRPRMRAAALAAGFLSFCEPESGELQALVDLGGDPISVALIYRGHPVSLSFLRNGFDYSSEAGLKHLAIELKTIINFRLSALSEQGIATPLARLIPCGEQVSDDVVAALEKWFPTGVTRPTLERSRFDPGLLPDGDHCSATNYLVALGVTVP